MAFVSTSSGSPRLRSKQAFGMSGRRGETAGERGRVLCYRYVWQEGGDSGGEGEGVVLQICLAGGGRQWGREGGDSWGEREGVVLQICLAGGGRQRGRRGECCVTDMSGRRGETAGEKGRVLCYRYVWQEGGDSGGEREGVVLQICLAGGGRQWGREGGCCVTDISGRRGETAGERGRVLCYRYVWQEGGDSGGEREGVVLQICLAGGGRQRGREGGCCVTDMSGRRGGDSGGEREGVVLQINALYLYYLNGYDLEALIIGLFIQLYYFIILILPLTNDPECRSPLYITIRFVGCRYFAN